MNKIRLIICLSLGMSITAFSQAITDSTIAMIAFWEMNDERVYEFVETEEKLKKGVKTLKKSNYDLTMTILDSSATNYRVKWQYDNHEIDYEMEAMEKEILEICGNIPVEYRTNELGAFETIVNWEEMKTKIDEAFTTVINKEALPDSIKLGLTNMITSMFSSEAQVNFWARDLNFFHYLYGASLHRTQPFEGVKNYTNPFIKTTMPGTQRVEVVAVDEENWIAKIKVTSGIDGDQAKALMIDFVKKNMKELGIENEEEIKEEELPNYSVEETMNYIYNIETGYILKGFYSKMTRVNEDYKRTSYNYKIKK